MLSLSNEGARLLCFKMDCSNSNPIACASEILYCAVCDLPRVWLLDTLNSNFLFASENLYNRLTGCKDWLAIWYFIHF
jgi:hypothetical protein